MKNFIIALIFIALPLTGRLAAQGFIRGIVTDKSGGEPLQGVYVIYARNKGTVSDNDGRFELSADTGKINLVFQFIGYRTKNLETVIREGETTDIAVTMEMELREIGQIVVSANRTEQRIAELSVSMNVLKKDDFLNTHITDAQELITKSPGIEIMDGQASVRGGSGFSYGAGSRVMALIDGLPAIAPDAGSIKWQFLPLENISQIEIIKGASSVLYGSSALNGVINFRSADAGIVPETNFYAETGIFGKPSNSDWKWWESPRVFSSASFSHLRKAGNTDIGIGAFLLLDNGYRKLNEEKLGRISLRIKHINGKIKGLNYGLNLNTGYTDKTDFVLWEDAEFGALKQDTSTASNLHGSFAAADPFVSYKKGRATHDLRMRFQFSDNYFPVRGNNNSQALSWYSEYLFNWKAADYLHVSAGASEQWSSVLSNFYGDHTGVNVAGFAQVEANPVHSLKIVAGFRAEQNFLDGKAEKIVPVLRTGLNWQAAELTFLRASFGQGYRYPSIAEKFASNSLGTVKIYPNPGVEPESGWSSEIGFRQGLLLGAVKGQADVALFMTRNENMIEYIFGTYPDPVTGDFGFGFQATNVEQAMVYGGELEFMLEIPAGKATATVRGGYSYIYPVAYNPLTNENTDIYLKYRRKHSFNLAFGAVVERLSAGLNLFIKSKILNIDDVFLNPLTRESILPGFYDYWLENNTGYFMMDGNISYLLGKGLSLSLAVKNITNSEYMGRPGDIQPHRNISLRLSGHF